MDFPIRQVETEWGPLYARAASGENVTFQTRSPNDDQPEQRVTVNRLWYSASIEMSRVPPTRRLRHYVDDEWHVDLTDISYRVQRYPAGGEATDNALATIRRRMLPQLAAWLRSPDGEALLGQGAAYALAERLQRARSAEAVLRTGIDHVHRIQGRTEAGDTAGTGDHELLRHINNDFARLLERVGEVVPPIPGHLTVRTPIDPPEVPGI